jgi:hypothetical protein
MWNRINDLEQRLDRLEVNNAGGGVIGLGLIAALFVFLLQAIAYFLTFSALLIPAWTGYRYSNRRKRFRWLKQSGYPIITVGIITGIELVYSFCFWQTKLSNLGFTDVYHNTLTWVGLVNFLMGKGFLKITTRKW